METQTRLEKWWDKTFDPKKKQEPASPLLRMLRRPKGSTNFADKRMQRGVQIAIEQKRRPARLERIYDSMRRANVIAKERRDAYVQRRSAKWKKIVEAEMPRMVVAALLDQGLEYEMGSGKAPIRRYS